MYFIFYGDKNNDVKTFVSEGTYALKTYTSKTRDTIHHTHNMEK